MHGPCIFMHGKHGIYIIMLGNAWDVNAGSASFVMQNTNYRRENMLQKIIQT